MLIVVAIFIALLLAVWLGRYARWALAHQQAPESAFDDDRVFETWPQGSMPTSEKVTRVISAAVAIGVIAMGIYFGR